jgi:PAS domain S-box-containing protein
MNRQVGLLVGLSAAGLAMAGGAIALTLTSSHEPQPVLDASLLPIVALSFICGGVIASWRRPGNRTGLIMAAVGFVFMLGALSVANESWTATVGTVFGGLFIVVFAHLLLAYPSGMLGSRFERLLIATGYTVAFLANLLPRLFEQKLDSSCKHDCPANAFLITPSSTTADVLDAIFSLVGIVLFLCVIVILVRRWRQATVPMRRVLLPVYLSGGLSIVFIAATFAGSAASSRAGDILFYIAFFWFAVLPLVFLGGLLRTRLARVAAARMLLEQPDEPTLGETEEGLRRALGDPTLELLVWDPDEYCYVDAHDHNRDEPRETARRAVTRIDPDGTPLAALVHDVALRDEPDLLAEVVATARLALQKEHGRQALARSQARMRALLDAMPDLMIRFRRDGTYLDIRGDVKGLVRPREQMIGRSVREFLPAPVVDELMDCAAAALATRTTQTAEYELELDGETRIFEARMVPSADDEIVSIVREITLARRLERELAERFAEVQHEQTFTRTVVNTAPIVLMLCDDEGGIIRFNDTTERITGRADDELVWGQRFWDVFVHPEDADAVAEAFLHAAPGPELDEIECRWLSSAGDERILACTFNQIVDGQGLTRRIIAGLDVTERERDRREIRASRARLVEAQDAERRRLERNLHDGAQQRLVSLSLALRLAQAKLSADPEGAGDILTAAGDELALALAELRELARGIHPAMLTDRGLGAAVESLATRAPLPVELAAMPEERLPAPVEAAAFYVISEALANIGKYAQATAARISVTRVDGHALVEVDDDGVGGADPNGGSGLRGLVDRVEALDGRLDVVSPDGGGTRIRAEIPCPR